MTEPKETTGVQAVLFALEILEYVAVQREAVGVTLIADHFGTNKSKVFRHLRTLAQQGYVVQDEASERYRVGARMIALGHAINDSVDIVREAEPVMRKVRNALGHSVILGMMDKGGVRVVSVQPGKSAIEISVKPGSLLGYYHSAQGKIAMAYGSAALVRKVCAAGLDALTPQTITGVKELERELAQIRKQGWSIAPGESVTGLNALAVPIFDASGQVVATVAIVDSVQFVSEKPTKLQIDTLVSAGLSISESIGFRAGRNR
ncbi:IclR family transcriptional regulator [Polaromonas sp.]|uniref:IclR family transcriptional regulator n=1 Tax=Polaromonas sp. TaxID=1869339 RepID=UPI003BAA8EC3